MRQLGFSWPVITLLAALAAPRTIAHDVGLVGSSSMSNQFLAVGPPLIWIGAVVVLQVRSPFLTLLAIGHVNAVFLALIHQVLWNYAWDGKPPTLGGNLERRLSPGVEALVIRAFAVESSLAAGTGIALGAAAVGWVLSKLYGSITQTGKQETNHSREARAGR